jgi:MFS family permease
VGVLGSELAAAERAARERAPRISGDDAGGRAGPRVVEGQLQLLELHRHQGDDATGWLASRRGWEAPKVMADAVDDERAGVPSVEDAIDALEDGDRTIGGSPVRAALAQPTFRRVYIGACLSNIGMWAQNVVLGAFAYDLTGSASFVGVLLFAQLGPLLLFSLVGGLLADIFDRRRLLVTVQVTRAFLCFGLAAVAAMDDPSLVWLVVLTFLIGIGQSIFGPTYSALLPSLVGRDNLAGAVSLNSAQMNGTRVIGPIIGAAIFDLYSASWVFIISGFSTIWVISSLLSVRLPPPVPDTSGQQGFRRVLSGFKIARSDPIVTKCLVTVFAFSLLSLPFIGQMPVLADENLGIAARSTQYGILYACFGVGALIGALSIGTVLAGRRLERVVRVGLVVFAGALTVFALLRVPEHAYLGILVVGVFYFAVITSLSTVMQFRLDDSNRGRVMAIWIMCFGGTVPLGNLIAGPLIEATSITAVVLAGAAVALGLAVYADLDAPTAVRDEPAYAD